ncbi:MAG: hypothetical protein M0Z69_14555 [Actinomycetota bacterium]|nr:hypothetical protein [Actinomycetota bacterium]
MQLIVTCPACGRSWRSQAASGESRCKACRHRVYVPAGVRRAVEQAPDRRYSYDPRTGRLSAR